VLFLFFTNNIFLIKENAVIAIPPTLNGTHYFIAKISKSF
jgi:hypothetical protein